GILFSDEKTVSSAGREVIKNLPPVLKECIQQLDDYFSGSRTVFELDMEQQGTSFQQKVWAELMNIPFGKTISYIELARRIGNEKSIRAVGTANGSNNICIMVPCHRVIGSNGKLVGYGGGLWRKQWLLEHEQKFSPLKEGTLF
ncbi:MAG TPA: methylated-DNA--[protein]-cysteine S-methyltransferase, partial [Chitinophagaceae bacterium]